MGRRKKPNKNIPVAYSLPPDVAIALKIKAGQEGKTASEVMQGLALKYLSGDTTFERERAQKALKQAQSDLEAIDAREQAIERVAVEKAVAGVKKFYTGVTVESIPQKKTVIVQMNNICTASKLGAEKVFPLFYKTLPTVSSDGLRTFIKDTLDEMSTELGLPKE